MNVYKSVLSYVLLLGIYMMVYLCISEEKNVYESIWWYTNVNGNNWEDMKVYEALWCYKKAYESVWMLMSQYDRLWEYMIIYECKW